MKKLIVILVIGIIALSSVFAVRNVGNYSISEIEDPVMKEFMVYMRETGWLDDYYAYSIKQYDGEWTVFLEDFTDYDGIMVTYDGEDFLLARFAGLDLSDYDILDLLYAVNEANYYFYNWGTLILDGDLDLLYQLIISGYELQPSTLAIQLDYFTAVSAGCFDDVLDNI